MDDLGRSHHRAFLYTTWEFEPHRSWLVQSAGQVGQQVTITHDITVAGGACCFGGSLSPTACRSRGVSRTGYCAEEGAAISQLTLTVSQTPYTRSWIAGGFWLLEFRSTHAHEHFELNTWTVFTMSFTHTSRPEYKHYG